MDPIQVVLLGGTCVTMATGVVKSFRKRPKGEVLEQVVMEEEFARCAVCRAEADEYDDQKMRWVCNRHISVQSRPPVQQAQRSGKQLPPLQSKTQTQRPRVYRDPHDVETVRDERLLRQVQVRQSRLDDYEDDEGYYEEEEELCTHGRDPERCRACYQIKQARNARSVQRRPVQQLPVRQPKRVEAPDPLEVVIGIVEQYPSINEAQLADMLEAYPEDVRPFLAAAREELGIVLRRPGRSARKEREYR
jgi:hypothetical protein